MTNLEKFEDEIKQIVYCGEKFAVRKCDGEVEECRGMICSDCKFNGENTSCSRQRAKWMQEEYEKPTPKVDVCEHDKNEVLDKIRAELIQSIKNGTLKIESGNEELFRIIYKYKEESEDNK